MNEKIRGYEFEYNPQTGEFKAIKTNNGYEPTIGESNGYKSISLNGHLIQIHRLIGFLYHEEYFEGCIVHHKNKDKKDNRLENLKPVSKSEHSRIHKFDYKRPVVKKVMEELRKEYPDYNFEEDIYEASGDIWCGLENYLMNKGFSKNKNELKKQAKAKMKDKITYTEWCDIIQNTTYREYVDVETGEIVGVYYDDYDLRLMDEVHREIGEIEFEERNWD